MTAPPSPPANRHRLPSWLDVRLVLGVLLVLVSVLVGARVVAQANSSARVWAVTSDLSAGSVLTNGDLRSVRVRLFDNSGRYVSTGRSPAGQTLARGLGAGELLPKDALRPEACGSLVSIPVNAQHLPDAVRRGQQIDVYATPKGADADSAEQVLTGVTVQSTVKPKSGLGSSGGLWSITVRVPADKASAVVTAIRTAEIDVTVVSRDVDPEELCREPVANPSATPSPSKSPGKNGGGSTPTGSVRVDGRPDTVSPR